MKKQPNIEEELKDLYPHDYMDFLKAEMSALLQVSHVAAQF